MSSDIFKNFIAEHFKTFNAEDLILDETFRKIVKGEIGTESALDELVEIFPNKSEEIILAANFLKELTTDKYQHSKKQKEEGWSKIIQQKKRVLRINFFRNVAVLLLLVSIGSSILYLFDNRTTVEKSALLSTVKGNKPLLILSDGNQIVLNSKPSEIQHYPDGSFIYYRNKSRIEYKPTEDGFNAMVVPYGERSLLLLSDGSKVWLNSGSKLTFPSSFKGKNREVYLEGEAYFDISKHSGKPFFVKTDAFTIKVYGTKLDVLAYKKDNDYSTTLLEGKVSIIPIGKFLPEEVFLVPKQKATSSKDHKNIQITEVENIENTISWVNGYLTFDNESITSVIQRISHYYNISIELNLKSNNSKLSGKLELKDDVERVLRGLTVYSKTKYIKNNNNYIIYE
jgi:ferric-dicitrate binding protein FerR (iron transport regulator)